MRSNAEPFLLDDGNGEGEDRGIKGGSVRGSATRPAGEKKSATEAGEEEVRKPSAIAAFQQLGTRRSGCVFYLGRGWPGRMLIARLAM